MTNLNSLDIATLQTEILFNDCIVEIIEKENGDIYEWMELATKEEMVKYLFNFMLKNNEAQ